LSQKFLSSALLAFPLKRLCHQRQQVDENRIVATYPGNVLSLDAAKISRVAAALCFSIRVDDLTIETGLGTAEAVIVTHNARYVYYKRDDITFARLGANVTSLKLWCF
jgi:hypothetical protein